MRSWPTWPGTPGTPRPARLPHRPGTPCLALDAGASPAATPKGYGDSDTSSSSWQEFHLGPGSRTRGTTTSRNWTAGQSWADGTSWSDATATQRVYEYAVEPAVLQNLPDHALLLAARGPAGPHLQAVECDPAIATLPSVSTRVQVPVPRAGAAR